MRGISRVAVIAALLGTMTLSATSATADHCARGRACVHTELADQAAQVSAQDVSTPDSNGLRVASSGAPTGPALFTWRLRDPCTRMDAAAGVACDSRTR